MHFLLFLRKSLAGIATCTVAAGAALAQSAPAPEHELKAAFIYNFIQFTQWPESAFKGTTLNLCVTRGTILYMALEPVTGKIVHGRTIALVPTQPEQSANCHVLVAESSDRGQAHQIRRVIANEPVLTITDDPELMREGFMIGMLVEGKRIAFIVDGTRASEARLTVSSRLLRLAKSVR